MKTLKLLCLLLCISAFSIFKAQNSTNYTSYQAVARNNTGAILANTAVGVKISILAGNATVLQSTQHTVTTNANGYFSINLPVSSNHFGEQNTQANQYKIELDPAGGTNYSVTVANFFTAVPYAIYAKNGVQPESKMKRVYVNGAAFGRDNNTDFYPAESGLRWPPLDGFAGFTYPRPANWDQNMPIKIILYFAMNQNSTNSFVKWRMYPKAIYNDIPQANVDSGWDTLGTGSFKDSDLLVAYATTRLYVVKSVTFTSQWSSTFNCQYFGTVNTADSFRSTDDKDIWEFNFRRGAAPTVNNGETYTGNMTVLGAAIEYWEK